ncbi:AAA family ATPase [Sulfurimonas sp. C5]|uniref:AAA family ATPase n=1 Tax=Sulfurimonas sp. C5 TaxID=3036947 RepID=UPI002457A88C|nr:AAA family ATPase [Sulfurimonas sp. C5]MDH4943961.1 AAA family ATPase [Sulfurimonas sp. C5]
MKFNSISIKDLFSYQGEVTFDFNDSSKPIALIIGENGFGKTSFINSVKIALHGITKDLLSMGELVLSKQDYILGSKNKNFSGVLNRISKLNGANKASVKIEVDDAGESFYIYREYVIGSNSYTENLSVYDHENNLLYSDLEAQDFINYKISPTLAKFFFFDGEKIQTIADFSKDEFRQMLEDVLELDIYDQLITDSTNVIKKINKSELDSELQQKLTQKEEELFEVESKLTSVTKEYEDEKLYLNQLLTEQKDLDRKLSKLQSKHKKPLEEAKLQLQSYEEEKETYQKEFKEVSYMQLPLLLNKKLKESVEKDIQKNYKGNVTISQNIIDLKKKEFLEHIDETQKGSIESIFDKVFNSDNNRQSVAFADPEKIEHQYNTLKKVEFQELINNLIAVKENIVQTQNEIFHLEQNFQNDQKEYKKDFEKVKTLAENIGQQKAKVESLEKQIEKLQYEKKEIEREIGRTSIKEHQNSLVKLKIESLESAITVAKQMKIKIKEDKKEILEKSINVKFNLLKKEGYEADSIQLDNDFNINVYDKDMNPMDILSSSSGQKQVIATALIWGISEYIAEDIPMIIDTPLGRLDEKNQALILNQFYPNASKQVLILPTPSELRHEGFQELQSEISQIFTLANKGSATTMQEKNITEFFDSRYTK